MKRFLSVLCALLLLCTSLVHAEDYIYFSSAEMPVTYGMDTDRAVLLGGAYYVTDAQGQLWRTQTFYDWQPVEGMPLGCRLLETGRTPADKLLVYAQNTLYISTDGYLFTPTMQLQADSVARYSCGLYTVMSRSADGFCLEYSFDGTTWDTFPTELISSSFSVLWLNENQIALKGVQLAQGKTDVLFNKLEPGRVLLMNKLVYDSCTSAVTDDALHTGPDLIYADSPSAGSFLYVYRADATAGYLYQIIRLKDGQITDISNILAGRDLQLNAYRDTLFFSKDGKSTNLIHRGGNWVQLDEETAFPVLRKAASASDKYFFDTGYTKQYYLQNDRPILTDRAGVEVVLNGYFLAFDSAPQIVGNRTMVPLRAIAEALGCAVSFNDVTREICIRRSDGVSLYMTLGSDVAKTVWADGNITTTKLDATPVIYNDRTLVPLRYVSENLNLTVEWIESTKTVILK